MTLSAQELQLDLNVTFPGLDPRSLPEDVGAWRGPKLWVQAPARMQDGLPVHLPADAPASVPGYTHGVHDGLRNWLALRGWCVISYAGIHWSHMGALGIDPAVVTPGGPVQLLVPTTTVVAALEEAHERRRSDPLEPVATNATS